ncbi:MAG: beta-lactamase family protein [Anaerolineales bacterium]|nr:beta-lactamase family protein [Anaerolineales bacterium]
MPALFKPPTPAQVAAHFDRDFQKSQAAGRGPAQVRVYSQTLGVDYTFPAGSGGQPYHIASVGKVFTAVLVRRLAERGQLDLAGPAAQYLPADVLERLFVVRGRDYAGQVTLAHLLNHTSGAADYFEGGSADGRTFLAGVLAQPERRWTPRQLLDYTRDHQAAVGAPGQVFNYSDTGYLLLGLVVEAVTGKPFAQNLADEFFRPLAMRDSYLLFGGEPARTPRPALEKIWFNGVEISGYESLSCDWAGGGIVATTDDLLRFSRALRAGQLLRPDSLAAMEACPHKFRPGLYYGSGLMEVRFGEFFFLLGGLPKLKGHIGILATHLFYDAGRDAHIILNFGANTLMEASFRALIEIETALQRLR